MGINYDLQGLLDELDEAKGSKKSGDDFRSDFWKPTIEDGEDTVEYTIRFLPNPDAETSKPWVERAAHMFSFPSGKFVYEPCPKKCKVGKCPFCEAVDNLYATEDPAQEEIASKRYSRKRFFYYVQVVKDARDGGANEGKVLIYEAGAQVHNKIDKFIHDAELPPKERLFYHPQYGTDFRLIVKRKHNYPNYDDSTFARRPSPMEVDGEVVSLEEANKYIEENAPGLNQRLFNDKTFKDYDTLKELYENQGILAKKPSSETETKSSDSSEEEVATNIEDVEVRNPDKKVDAEKETDDQVSAGSGMTDEEAELEELLNS